jgi:hypothetical protein
VRLSEAAAKRELAKVVLARSIDAKQSLTRDFLNRRDRTSRRKPYTAAVLEYNNHPGTALCRMFSWRSRIRIHLRLRYIVLLSHGEIVDRSN